MSRFLMAASISLGMLCSGMAFAQSSMTAPDNSSDSGTNSVPGKLSTGPQPGMAATTSDSGNMSTGASSAAIGTGHTEKGDNSPEAPALSGNTATGANPHNPGGVPDSSQ